MTDFLDFRLIVSHWTPNDSDPLSGRYTVMVVAETGEPRKPIWVDFSWENIRPQLVAFRGKHISRSDSELLRRELGKMLLPSEDILLALRQAEVIAKERKKTVRIRLDIVDERLTALPWEYAEIKQGKPFAGYYPGYSIVRHARSLGTIDHMIYDSEKIRFLFVSSDNLADFDFLDADKHVLELGNLVREFADSEDIDAQIKVITEATSDDFLTALEEKWHVVHFAGHGEIMNRDANLVLRSSHHSRNSSKLYTKSLAPKIMSAGVKVVNLCACHSGQSMLLGGTNGIAGSLALFGIPAVLSMQDSVRPNSAYTYNMTIYRQLIRGEDIERATILGRLAIAENDEGIDWAIPILHFHQSNSPIFVGPSMKNQARTVARFGEVDAQDDATFLEIAGGHDGDIETDVDKLSLKGKSTGIRL